MSEDPETKLPQSTATTPTDLGDAAEDTAEVGRSEQRFTSRRSTHATHYRRLAATFSHDSLLEHPFFQHCDPELFYLIIENVRTEIFLPGAEIIQEGAEGSCMYFLHRGAVECVKGEIGSIVAQLGDGTVFGELALLGDGKRTCTVRAVDLCGCRVLTKEVFDLILQRFPHERKFFLKLAEERGLHNNARLAAAEPVASSRPASTRPASVEPEAAVSCLKSATSKVAGARCFLNAAKKAVEETKEQSQAPLQLGDHLSLLLDNVDRDCAESICKSLGIEEARRTRAHRALNDAFTSDPLRSSKRHNTWSCTSPASARSRNGTSRRVLSPDSSVASPREVPSRPWASEPVQSFTSRQSKMEQQDNRQEKSAPTSHSVSSKRHNTWSCTSPASARSRNGTSRRVLSPDSSVASPREVPSRPWASEPVQSFTSRQSKMEQQDNRQEKSAPTSHSVRSPKADLLKKVGAVVLSARGTPKSLESPANSLRHSLRTGRFEKVQSDLKAKGSASDSPRLCRPPGSSREYGEPAAQSIMPSLDDLLSLSPKRSRRGSLCLHPQLDYQSKPKGFL